MDLRTVVVVVVVVAMCRASTLQVSQKCAASTNWYIQMIGSVIGEFFIFIFLSVSIENH